MVVPILLVHLDDESAHILLLFEVHAGHRLVEQQKLRLHRQRAPELDALLQAISQTADRHAADRRDFQKVDDVLDQAAMDDFLADRRAMTENCQKSPRFIFSARPVKKLSSVVMPRNSATF